MFRSSRRLRRGMTVVELAAGLALVAVVLGGSLLFLRPGLQADKTDAAVRDAMRIREAALDWKQANAEGCPTLSQLQHEKHLTDETRTDDPWGQRFKLECSDEDVVVRSEGRDGRPGTEDDIRVPHSRS
jgi:general secretion pathway protein G